jgi:hypothetical protein
VKIEYFTVEGVEARFFNCDKLSLSLTPETCAGRHVEAQAKERFFSCRDCKIGAHHAGRRAPVISLLGSKLCSRCRRPAGRLVEGRLCVSCMNRQYEAQRGRNAKGGIPKKLSVSMLMPIHVQANRDGSRPVIELIPRSTGFVESVMSAGRRVGADAGFFAARLEPPVIARPIEWRRVAV